MGNAINFTFPFLVLDFTINRKFYWVYFFENLSYLSRDTQKGKISGIIRYSVAALHSTECNLW